MSDGAVVFAALELGLEVVFAPAPVVFAGTSDEPVSAAPAPGTVPVYVELYDACNFKTLVGSGAMVTLALEQSDVYMSPA